MSDSSRSLSILLVNGTSANRKILEKACITKRHSVTTASNVDEAIECVNREHFDAVLMDLQKPISNGHQATIAIRELEQQRGTHTSIIALTANTAAEGSAECPASEMDVCLTEPVDVDELTRIVQEVAARQAHLDGDARQSDEEESGKPSEPEQAASSSEPPPIMNLQATMKRLGGDETLLQVFIEVYYEDVPMLMEEIAAGLSSGDRERVFSASHSLRGLAANFDAVSVVDAALEVETSAKQGDLRSASEAREALARSVTALNIALEAHDVAPEPSSPRSE